MKGEGVNCRKYATEMKNESGIKHNKAEKSRNRQILHIFRILFAYLQKK